MRVLVVHNQYRSALPSGENVVVEHEIAALRTAGVDVETYVRSSDEIAEMGVGHRLLTIGAPVYGRTAVRALRDLVVRTRPDVAHLHNVYPLISPAAISAFRSMEVPVVHTVHNRRLGCVEGACMRDGKDCEQCVGRVVPWPALAHGCYRGSRVLTTPMALGQVVHRGTWRGVSRYLVPTEYSRHKLAAVGVPDRQITVKPNLVEDPGTAMTRRQRTVVFTGRLEAEKGVDRLLAAWPRARLAPPWELVVAGDGPLRPAVEAFVERHERVRYAGHLDSAGVGALLARAACAVVPSRVAESGSLAVIEALAHGVPVIASDRGALPEMIEGAGWVFHSDEALVFRLAALGDLDVVREGAAARRVFEERFTPDRALRTLLDVYDEVAGTAA